MRVLDVLGTFPSTSRPELGERNYFCRPARGLALGGSAQAEACGSDVQRLALLIRSGQRARHGAQRYVWEFGMATTTTNETFRCMACGHEYQEKVEKGEDKERSCPKCRSNSIRHLKKKK
jgi:hypothetical protein